MSPGRLSRPEISAFPDVEETNDLEEIKKP
jgi:hypothetical protein